MAYLSLLANRAQALLRFHVRMLINELVVVHMLSSANNTGGCLTSVIVARTPLPFPSQAEIIASPAATDPSDLLRRFLLKE